MLKTLAHAIMSRPLLYQPIQVLLGQNRSLRKLESVTSGLNAGRSLDIGSSSGALGRRVAPLAARIDIDIVPLMAMKKVHGREKAAAADAAALPFPGSTFDLALCVAVSHHLDDQTLDAALRDISRVTRGRFVFLDAVRSRRLVARILWRYDRGSHPRSRSELLAAIGKWFAIESTVEYSYLHEYVICVATPKTATAETT